MLCLVREVCHLLYMLLGGGITVDAGVQAVGRARWLIWHGEQEVGVLVWKAVGGPILGGLLVNAPPVY